MRMCGVPPSGLRRGCPRPRGHVGAPVDADGRAEEHVRLVLARLADPHETHGTPRREGAAVRALHEALRDRGLSIVLGHVAAKECEAVARTRGDVARRAAARLHARKDVEMTGAPAYAVSTMKRVRSPPSVTSTTRDSFPFPSSTRCRARSGRRSARRIRTSTTMTTTDTRSVIELEGL